MGGAIFQNWYEGKTVVVTGGYGYLGTGLCERLRGAGARLRRATRGRPNIENDREARVGDISDPAFCARLVDGADAVFHFGAQTSVPDSHACPGDDLRANAQATLTLLEACRHGGDMALVYAGTATAVGLPSQMPVGTGTPDQPVTVYDATKLASENLVGVYRANGWVKGVCLRIANVYGPGPAKSASDRGVTNRIIARALAGQDLVYYGDGNLLRDYVYVDDLLDAFFRVGTAAGSAAERYYVVAGGKGYSLREVFELIADTVAGLGRARVQVSSAPWPATAHAIDRRNFVADISPLRALCDWQPTTPLAEGVRKTAHFLVEG